MPSRGLPSAHQAVVQPDRRQSHTRFQVVDAFHPKETGRAHRRGTRSPTRSRAARALARHSLGSTPRAQAAYSTARRMRKCDGRENRWGRNPTKPRMVSTSSLTSTPFTRKWPDSGSRSVARILKSVDFPAPFGPSSPHKPEPNSQEMSTRLRRWRYRCDTCLSSIIHLTVT